jgi:hypothetical protein
MIPRQRLAWVCWAVAASLLWSADGAAAEPALEPAPWIPDQTPWGGLMWSPPPGTPPLIVEDVAALAALEARGLDFGSRVAGVKAAHNGDLAANARYRSLVATLTGDLKAIIDGDASAGVGLKYAHRIFNAAWLTAPRLRFGLIGVVNRIDRRAVAPDTCGETRLIYRLGYQAEVSGQEAASRLPMTVNVVYDLPKDGGGCAPTAAAWSGEWVAAQLEAGALRLKAVEVNLQSVRWPGTVHPSLGGHAEYLMRVFHLSADGSRYAPAPMESSPDVALLKRDPAKRQALLAWVRDPVNLAAIDRGEALVPEALLAKVAVSVAPHGLARLGNRAFAQVIKPAELEDLDLSGFTHIRSPQALLRRLDGMTCAGCHQSHSVAGFHLLGRELDPTQVVDALQVSRSPHLIADLGRRAHDLVALPGPPPPLPPPDYDPSGGPSSRCGVGDPGFAAWGCGEGLGCVATEDPLLGVCLSKTTREVGDPCEVGTLATKTPPNKDRIHDPKVFSCEGYDLCEASSVGFPSGMCATSCRDPGPRGVCGRIPLLVDFNKCVASKAPLHQCILDNTRPAGMRACDDLNPCRDDYICARTESGSGACLPPYFLFQMRVDGHPL